MKGFTTTFTTCKKTWSKVSVAMSMMLLAFLFSANINAQTVTTDHLDYNPGGTVTIYGSGWTPGETVTLRVTHDPPGGDDATSPDHQPWDVVADANGNFLSHWHVPGDQDELGATLLLTAHNSSSTHTAQATFTDNFSIDFQQGANKDNPFPLGTLHWINSILQNSNSRIVEGMSTLQRVIITDLTGGTISGSDTIHRMRIFLETDKAGFHAYDFITGWNQALRAAETIAPGFGFYPPSRSVANGTCSGGVPVGTFQSCNGLSTYAAEVRVCGSNISAPGADTCARLHSDEGVFRDLPVSGETNAASTLLDLVGDAPRATTETRIANYETRYGPRTVRCWVFAKNGFHGTNGDANNKVAFVKYEAGDIFYDIIWNSGSNSVALEFGAHVAVGQDGLDPNIGTNVGYGVGRGASNISGGPYHVKL